MSLSKLLDYLLLFSWLLVERPDRLWASIFPLKRFFTNCDFKPLSTWNLAALSSSFRRPDFSHSSHSSWVILAARYRRSVAPSHERM